MNTLIVLLIGILVISLFSYGIKFISNILDEIATGLLKMAILGIIIALFISVGHILIP